jgi:type I restriction enzyme R subunit
MYKHARAPRWIDSRGSKRRSRRSSATRLTGYVRLYSFLSQVMPFTDEDLEKLYTFCRFLELKLPKDDKKAPLDLDGDVALKFYRLDKINEGQILLLAEPVVPLRSPTDVGTRKAKDDEVALSEIIDVLNERFGTEFTNADQLLFDSSSKPRRKTRRSSNEPSPTGSTTSS